MGPYRVDIEQAVRSYADMVYRLAMLHSKNKEESEDAFQEVFLKLCNHQNSITSEEHLKAWLIRVTINQCRSMAVTVWNQRRVSLDELPEPAVEEKEDYSEVYDAVKRLPDKYKQVIHLFYFEELTISEIANILHKKEATVKTWMSRGKKMLESKLGREFE